jgi:hypothetical protein
MGNGMGECRRCKGRRDPRELILARMCSDPTPHKVEQIRESKKELQIVCRPAGKEERNKVAKKNH